LTPQVGTHELIGRVLEFLLSLGRDGSSVDLIALTIVIGSFDQQDTTTISTLAIGSPHTVNVSEQLIIFGIGGSIDKDVTTVLWLARLVPRQCHMAIFLVAKSDGCARRSLQART
jgi:hypothetical protein